MAMILSITRGIVDSVQAQPQHKWVGPVRQKLLELTDFKMGIIGLGSIGKALAKRAYAFDMHVIAVDMFPTNKPDYVHELWGLERQNELLAESDIVVVTVPWTPRSRA